MTKTVDAELRLVSVIREAKEFISRLKDAKESLKKQYDLLPKSVKKDQQLVKDMLDKADEISKALRVETAIAHDVANTIQGHIMWKAAVLRVFGVDGLKECYQVMEEEKQANKAIEQAHNIKESLK